MEITSIKLQTNGYLVNGTTSVPTGYSGWMSESIDKWLETNTPEPEFTEAEIQAKTNAEISNAIQSMLDKKAQEFRYDNMMSARSYTGYENPFKAEAVKLSTWAATCWVKAGELEGQGVPMTVDDVLAQMPEYVQ